MAAFTNFSQQALERYLIMFDLGEVTGVEPIAEGIENSNYFLKFGQDIEEDVTEYVLTITESLGFEEVPFFNDLLSLLARAGLPVPVPQTTLDGMVGTIFCGKPTWLFSRLPGSHPELIHRVHCDAIGGLLARLHEVSKAARYSRPNPYSSAWATETLSNYSSSLNEKTERLLLACIEEYATFEANTSLPRGIIHGDLFKDNALFEGDSLTGIIDFYHACDDFLIQDIAITINDWCYIDGVLDEELTDSLLTSYSEVRELTKEERNTLPIFQRFAAMRFALTRLLSGKDGEPLKNPQEFIYRLETLYGQVA